MVKLIATWFFKYLLKNPRETLKGYKTYIFALMLAAGALQGSLNELIQYLAGNISLATAIDHIWTIVADSWTQITLGGGLAALAAKVNRAKLEAKK